MYWHSKEILSVDRSLDCRDQWMQSIFSYSFLQQSLIMNKKVDKERDKRASSCRHVIKQTLSDAYTSRPALRPQRTLAQEIAFAKEIILKRGRADPWVALRRTKDKLRVQWLDESVNPLDTSASTSANSNTKGYRKWKVRIEQWNPPTTIYIALWTLILQPR